MQTTALSDFFVRTITCYSSQAYHCRHCQALERFELNTISLLISSHLLSLICFGLFPYHGGPYFRYRQSANQDYAASQCGLGILYEQGRGVERNDAEAVKWYRKAAEQGDAAAQTNLGTMINDGRGTGKSDKLAVRWYRKAAEQGYARAQCNLGYKYDLGEGVPQCDASAVYWYDTNNTKMLVFYCG